MEQHTLKTKLLENADNKFDPQKVEDINVLMEAMLANIGSTDPELRDDLIYSAFANWIYRYRALSSQQLQYILSVVTDEEHMFFNMSEKEGDAVFTRAFSVLLLPLILLIHRDKAYLSEDQVREVKQKLLRFMQNEQDRRGFVKGKGWAHALAHASDALDELALCEEMGKPDLVQLLDVLAEVVCISEGVYTHGEEERFATAAFSILGRGLLDVEQISSWLDKLVVSVKAVETMPTDIYIRSNVKNFLQSLYFRLTWHKVGESSLQLIDAALRSINRYAP